MNQKINEMIRGVSSNRDSGLLIARNLINIANREKHKREKLKVVFIELSCCIGESIVLLNADKPDFEYFLKEMIDLQFSHAFSLNDGKYAYEDFKRVVKEGGYILILGGATPLGQDGMFNILGLEEGREISAKEMAVTAAKNSKLIIYAGTCSCFGGISAAPPNPTNCISARQLIKESGINKPHINIPGCPTKSEILLGTLAYYIEYGMPILDDINRPLAFFGRYIHENCERRAYFDAGIFAAKMGEKECYYKLGCLGPITKTNCALYGWNGTNNWPVGNNSPCIGCAFEGFPHKIKSFIKEEGELYRDEKRSKNQSND